MISGIAGGMVAAAQQEFARKIQEAQSASLRQFVNNMQSAMPAWDAVCRYHTGASYCENCCDTNREPIPLREVMSNAD